MFDQINGAAGKNSSSTEHPFARRAGTDSIGRCVCLSG
jgi:hypothetical protein